MRETCAFWAKCGLVCLMILAGAGGTNSGPPCPVTLATNSTMDRLLDAGLEGPRYLSMPEIAEIVTDAIRYNADSLRHYQLHAFVVMPNHVHMLVDPAVSLPKLTRSLKSITARRANLILNRTGQAFWAEETFDRNLRSREEFARIHRYIENNPVRAGLLANTEDYLLVERGKKKPR